MKSTIVLRNFCHSVVVRSRVALTIAPVVFVLSACSGGPPPRLYLLPAPVVDSAGEKNDTSSLEALGISQVKLPGYASDTRIASIGSDGVVAQLDGQRWAEEPEDAITRLLAKRLRERATATVLVEPWPRDYAPQARIEVVFDRLLREADGGASLAGQIQLLSGDGRRLLQSVQFERRIASQSMESKAYFTSIAIAVDDIARMAVEALLGIRSLS